MFQRQDHHLICQVPVTFSQAALGGEIEVPTLGRATLKQLERGTQHGAVIRITGKECPICAAAARAICWCRLLVETPKHLNKRQEELLRELAELEKKNVSPQPSCFWISCATSSPAAKKRRTIRRNPKK